MDFCGLEMALLLTGLGQALIVAASTGKVAVIGLWVQSW
jgi:hypothetical protein